MGVDIPVKSNTNQPYYAPRRRNDAETETKQTYLRLTHVQAGTPLPATNRLNDDMTDDYSRHLVYARHRAIVPKVEDPPPRTIILTKDTSSARLGR